MTKPDWTTAANLPPEELNRLLEEDHDEVDDNPEATDAELAARRPGTLRPGQRGPGKRPAKVPLTVRVEPAALAAWKASGAGWQSRINDLVVREAPKSAAGEARSHGPHAEVAGEAGPRSTHRRRASFEADLRSAPQDEEETGPGENVGLASKAKRTA